MEYLKVLLGMRSVLFAMPVPAPESACSFRLQQITCIHVTNLRTLRAELMWRRSSLEVCSSKQLESTAL